MTNTYSILVSYIVVDVVVVVVDRTLPKSPRSIDMNAAYRIPQAAHIHKHTATNANALARKEKKNIIKLSLWNLNANESHESEIQCQ